MKISMNVSRFFVVVAAGFFLLAVGPAHVMAGGEPGGGCGEGFKYDPAPYIGDITLEWKGGDGSEDEGIYASGIVEQAGNSGCRGTFSGLIVPNISLDEFQTWTASDLRLTCLENTCDFSSNNCAFTCLGDDARLEVIAVGGMTWLTDSSFTAKFVIMALK